MVVDDSSGEVDCVSGLAPLQLEQEAVAEVDGSDSRRVDCAYGVEGILHLRRRGQRCAVDGYVESDVVERAAEVSAVVEVAGDVSCDVHALGVEGCVGGELVHYCVDHSPLVVGSDGCGVEAVGGEILHGGVGEAVGIGLVAEVVAVVGACGVFGGDAVVAVVAVIAAAVGSGERGVLVEPPAYLFVEFGHGHFEHPSQGDLARVYALLQAHLLCLL